jgi:hypothetical protein
MMQIVPLHLMPQQCSYQVQNSASHPCKIHCVRQCFDQGAAGDAFGGVVPDQKVLQG